MLGRLRRTRHANSPMQKRLTDFPILTASPILRLVFEEMARQGFSARKMSELAGTSHGNISGWKLGKREPGVMKVEDMAHQLGFRLTLEPTPDKEPK